MASLKDVALKAGVSISTASRALGNKPGLSSETYEHVRRIAEEMNYKPNPSARLLAGKRSKIIGIVVPELTSPYFASLLHEIEPLLSEKGYYLLIMSTGCDSKKELDALQAFCTFQADGVFLTTMTHKDVLDRYIETLSANQIAFVGLQAQIHNDNYNYIKIDDEYGICACIQHFLDRGYDRVCFLSDFITDEMRSALYLSALQKYGLSLAENPIYSHAKKRHEIAGYELMKQIMATEDHPHAIIASYDDLAVGAIRAVKDAGYSVPKDYSFIGNDNIPSAPFLQEALSTLSPPVKKMAELGVKILLEQIENSESENMVNHVILRPELIVRETG